MTSSGYNRPSRYEHPGWHAITGGVLRPGGLELTEHALALCGLPVGARVVDVGCGEGASVQYLRGRRCSALGVDRSAELLRRARQLHPSLPLLLADAHQLPIADHALDAAMAECSLSTMADPGVVLAELRRTLRPGGHLIMSDVYARSPAGAPDLRRLPSDACLAGARSHAQIADLLDAHRFQIAQWEDHSALLRPLAAQLGLTEGPVDQSAEREVGAAGADAFDRYLAIARARPGYFLLIAIRHAD